MAVISSIWTGFNPYGRYGVRVDVTHPYAAVSPSLDGEVLHVLAGADLAMTGRQIALLTGRTSHSGVLEVLNRLTEHGLVKRVELNHAYLFSLNRDHIAADAVMELAGLKGKLLQAIRHEIGSWSIPPIHASLFGSAARGDGDTSSDIDLLLVRSAAVAPEDPEWQEQLETLEEHIRGWTGNLAAIIQTSESDLRLNAARIAVLGEDAITLSGPNIATLLNEA
jgi:predicted nucleotidyltransferase